MPHSMNALSFLVDTLIGAYFIVAIARFLLQALRGDAGNSLVQTIIAMTNPPLRFLRRCMPNLGRLDAAPAVLMFILGFAKLALPLLIAGDAFNWGGAAALSAAKTIDTVVRLLLFAVLARVVLSWVAPRNTHPAARLVGDLSEPLMAPWRRLLPTLGGLDFSPIVTILALQLIQQLAVSPLLAWARSLL